MKYRVLLHKSEEGYCRGFAPDFPTCNAQSSTAEDALEIVRYALHRIHLAVREDLLLGRQSSLSDRHCTR